MAKKWHIFLEDETVDELVVLDKDVDGIYYVDTIQSSSMLLTNYEACVKSAKQKWQGSELVDELIVINKILERKFTLLQTVAERFEYKKFTSNSQFKDLLKVKSFKEL
mgnify:CR=1 FL=1